MEAYHKKFFIGLYLGIATIAAAAVLLNVPRFFIMFLFIGLLAALFFYLDSKYLPKRRVYIDSELSKVFLAQSVSEGVSKFGIKGIEIFTKTEIDFKQGLQLANFETIRFCIPKSQIGHLVATPRKLQLIEDDISGIPTYDIYQTGANGLQLAKKELEKMIV